LAVQQARAAQVDHRAQPADDEELADFGPHSADTGVQAGGGEGHARFAPFVAVALLRYWPGLGRRYGLPELLLSDIRAISRDTPGATHDTRGISVPRLGGVQPARRCSPARRG